MIAGTDAAAAGCAITPARHPEQGPEAWLAELATSGFTVRDGLLPDALALALLAEARRLRDEEALRRAGIGREEDHELNARIRRDRVAWLSGATLAQVQYLEAMEQLRRDVNEALFLGLFAFESHFALYEPGAFYARHVDAFRGGRNRVLSTVLYLNDSWRAGDGGELAIYPPDAQADASPSLLIEPLMNRTAIFLSEEIPHAVLTANAARSV